MDWQTLRRELVAQWIAPNWVCIDKAKKLEAAYVPIEDVVERLDALVGTERWQLDVSPLAGAVTVTARLTIGGITKAATGESEPTIRKQTQRS